MTQEDKEVVSMKSIEERAKLASEGYEDDGYSAGLYMGYVEGATEQKEIDIEKACKIYRDELQRLKTQLDESVGVPANLVSVDKSLSRIRLEMEEQI